MATAILLNKDQMGHGDAELGRKILATFLRKSIAVADLEWVCLFNAGVKLATRDSPVAPELTLLHERGVDVIPCATCVDFYGLRNNLCVERIGTMDDIVDALRKATRVVTL
ncbi:MAG: DsrE family protein [Phycisphaerae bacterium]